MNGSVVTAKTAGIESSANMMSVVSTATSTASSGVASRRPALEDDERRAAVVLGHGHETAE